MKFFSHKPKTQDLEKAPSADPSTIDADRAKEAALESSTPPAPASTTSTNNAAARASVSLSRPITDASLPRNDTGVDAITSRPSQQITSTSSYPSQPPPLHYSLDDNHRKITIFWFWSLIVVDIIAIPIILYFALFYLTSLSHEAVFSISTGCLGGVSIIEYFVRFYRLFKKGSTCRPIGARRWYMDWFHWNFSIAWFPIMVELIIGTSMDEPPIRLLAMPVSTLCWWFGFEMLLSDILRILRVKQFLRISSVPVGEPFRPCIYALIEDIVAVDGSGGTEFRINLDKRYKASHYFRVMLHRLALFWGFGAVLAATVTTVLVFTLEHDAAYVVGWCLPFVWAGISALITMFWVKKSLRYEREQWALDANLKARRDLAQSRFSTDVPRRSMAV